MGRVPLLSKVLISVANFRYSTVLVALLKIKLISKPPNTENAMLVNYFEASEIRRTQGDPLKRVAKP